MACRDYGTVKSTHVSRNVVRTFELKRAVDTLHNQKMDMQHKMEKCHIMLNIRESCTTVGPGLLISS